MKREEVERLCEELASDPISNSRNISLLLVELDCITNEKLLERVLQCLVEFFADGSPASELKKEGSSLQDPETVYGRWFQDSCRRFKEKLIDSLISEITNMTTKIQFLKTSLDLVASENTGEFGNEFFRAFLTQLLSSQNSSEVLEALVTIYGSLADVRYFTLQTIAFCCRQAKETHPIPQNIINVLLSLPKTLDRCLKTNEGLHQSLTCASETGFAVAAITGFPQQRKRRRSNLTSPETKGVKWLDTKEQKKQFSLAWKHFLCLDLSPVILVCVLEALPQNVMPYLSSPLGLSDFLTGALNQRGFIGLLALHGIFLLMTGHNLEYPEFFKRVYNLLSLEVFSWKQHQSKFFKMLNTFLKSELIPAYTVAAFVKKFGRFAVQTNPSGAMICITFIHNLIRRHPACYCLIHKEVATREVTDWQEFDCYDEEETDPSLSRAIESSLWEIEALGNHWCPQVAAHAEILLKDLTQRITTSEESLQVPLGVSYDALFDQCVDRTNSDCQLKSMMSFSKMNFVGWSV